MATHAVVVLDDRLPLDLGLKKLKGQLLKGGVLREMKERASFVGPSRKRRLKSLRVRRKRRVAEVKAAHLDALYGERLAYRKLNPEGRRSA